jgi:hypothetical protein
MNPKDKITGRPVKPPPAAGGTGQTAMSGAAPAFQAAEAEAGGEEKPRDLSETEMALASTAREAVSAPQLEPPAAAMGEEGGIGAWLSDKRVNALWGINQNRNSWVGIAGVGWKKLANNSDSAVVALTILSAHARLSQTGYYGREEADGMIHEVYVW